MKVLVKVKLSPHKYKTDEGYLICEDAIIARTGKQEYQKSEIYENCYDTDIVEVDRKPEQVFDSKTLASFENKPLTIEHPDENVTPDNYKEYSAGFIRDVRQGKADGQDVILANIVVTDPVAIHAIETGSMTELSCGYDCDITEGEHPEQINIRGNHVALCEQGRAGIARIVDSQTQDSMKLEEGCMVQDFGKKACKYKVRKIIGNTVYAEDLVTGETILLRADKLGHDYAVIKNAAKLADSERFRYVIWYDPINNMYKGSDYKNYKSENPDVSKIQEFRDKGSAYEIIDDLLAHPESGIESRDEIVVIGDMIFDSRKQVKDSIYLLNGKGEYLAEDENGDIVWESNLRKPGIKKFESEDEANKYIRVNNIEESLKFVKDSQEESKDFDENTHHKLFLEALQEEIENAKNKVEESLDEQSNEIDQKLEGKNYMKDYIGSQLYEYLDIIIEESNGKFFVKDYEDYEHVFDSLSEAQDFIEDYYYEGEY